MVKSMPGAQHGDVLDFLKQAELVAFQRGRLWHMRFLTGAKKAKKQFIKTNKSSVAASA
jgi:hypothetical protein